MRQPGLDFGKRKNEQERGRENWQTFEEQVSSSFFFFFFESSYELFGDDTEITIIAARGDFVLPKWQLFTVRENDT